MNAATAVVASTVIQGAINGNSLDNTNWLLLKTASLDMNNDFGKNLFTNILSNIAARRPVRVQSDGTGLVGVGQLFMLPELTNLDSLFSGCYNSMFPYIYTSGGSGAFESPTGKDTFWYQPYNRTTDNGGALQIAVTYPWDVAEVDYVINGDGATWSFQTNNGSGYASAVTGINSVGALAGASLMWTNPNGPQQLSFQVVATSIGTNRFVNYGAWNSIIANGIQFGTQSHASSGVTNQLNVNNGIRAPIYSNWRPNLILWSSIEGIAMTNLNQLPAWIGFYQSSCPAAGIVLCGIYPEDDGSEVDANYAMQLAALRTHVAYLPPRQPRLDVDEL